MFAAAIDELALFGGVSPYLLRTLFAAAAGIIMGLEQKSRRHSVGMRTLILICVSSCLIMQVSVYAADVYGGDPVRIAAQVVSGIGFLGAGVILRYGLNIRGLTSAAIVWAVSALGLAIGAGMIIQPLIALVVCVLSLILFKKLENRFFPEDQIKRLVLVFSLIPNRPDFTAIYDVIRSYKIGISDMDVYENFTENRLTLVFSLKVSRNIDISAVVRGLMGLGMLIRYKFCE